MSKERRLGRGLEALLGRGPQAADKAGSDKSGPVQEAAAKEPMKIPQPKAATEKPMAMKPQAAVEEEKTACESTPKASGASGIGKKRDTAPGSVHTSMSPDKTVAIEQNKPSPPLTPPSVDKGDTDLVQVNVALIETNPFQPRKHFEEESMAELAESISAHGLLQPIVARRVDDVYQLIAGERRLRAAKKAGWEEVPVRVIETDERGVAELAIVENLQRKDLNALEKAASFKRYLKEHRCTQGQLANRLKIDRSTIANLMRLLELPDEVQNAVSEGKISQGHARALLPLGEQREQVAFCKKIQNDGLSVRKTETLVQETIQKADAEPLSVIGRDDQACKPPKRNAHITSLEQEFRAGLGTKVKLTQGNHGSGKLVIQFKNHEEFNRIKEHILGPNKPRAKAG